MEKGVGQVFQTLYQKIYELSTSQQTTTIIVLFNILLDNIKREPLHDHFHQWKVHMQPALCRVH